MRLKELAIALATAAVVSGHAAAQQPAAPNPEFDAQQQAAQADLLRAEKLLNSGARRGPDSEACKLMDSFFLHIMKAAAAAGANTRIAAWSTLTGEEQNAVGQKANPRLERDKRVRTYACTAEKP